MRAPSVPAVAQPRAATVPALTGLQKAATFMLAIGAEDSGLLLSMMADEEIREISSAMARLGPVQAEVAERLCSEFAASIGSQGGVVGSFDTTERLLLGSLPADRVSQIMEEIRGPAGRTTWDKLSNVSETVLANYLKNEHPQTVAVVLSRVQPPQAARVLTQLPEAAVMDVIVRMLQMEQVQKDVIEGVERTLRNDFMSNLSRSSRRGAHEIMAEIFNSLDRPTEVRFLETLEGVDAAAAERIRSLMFTFDDLIRIPPQGIQLLLRTVEKAKIALALKGASDELRELFFRNLSDRAGKILREDIEALGPTKMREVDAARATIVQTAKQLAAEGKIEIPSGAADEEVVY